MTAEEPALLSMGWYLDTSLFKDFVDRNVCRGFDSSERNDGHTLLHLTCRNDRKQVFVPLLVNGIRCVFELTANLDRLRCIQLTHGTRFFYSELTKAEIYRSLRRSHPERHENELKAWWDVFGILLADYQEIEIGFLPGGHLSHLALTFPIRKNVQDYIHIILARHNGLAFLTSDKMGDQIDDIKQNYYEHVYYWPEVKDSIAIDEIFTV